jgi:hypothetical protein
LFMARSKLIGDEQPHSVYFIDKFIQPTHLYLHSNPLDYPETAKKDNSTGWDQTVVTYEAFRMPKFSPKFIREAYHSGKFKKSIERK